MSKCITQWLLGDGVGESSKCIAAVALGADIPKYAAYPHDGDDFGRCLRLLVKCPDAQAGLDRLGKEGGAVWQALVPRWDEIKHAYMHDMVLREQGVRDHNRYRCFNLMQSIIRPIENAHGDVVRVSEHVTIRRTP